jgi:hypothetical protein
MANAAQKWFEAITSNDPKLIMHFTEDVDVVLKEAADIYDGLIPDMPYTDDPQHVMAGSMFFCASMLAVYLALKSRGADVHEFGRQVVELVTESARRAPPPAEPKVTKDMVEAAAASQAHAAPNEFVFEVYDGEGDVDHGMNIKSCAICALFSKRDAMDLVPYMCATDDVMSEAGGQGLKRSGTIALGAHHCDFTFKAGGEGRPLSDQYPDKIRIVD